MPGLSVIVVSPLMRAMQTAYLTFKDHPNFQNVQVILHPDLREKFDCSCSIGMPIQNVLKEFSDKFPNIDTSLMDLES